MILSKIFESFFRINDKPYIHANDRAYEQSLSAPKSGPSYFTKLLSLKQRLSTKSQFPQLREFIWLKRLSFSKYVQRVHYRSFHSKRRYSWVPLLLIGALLGDSMSYWEHRPGHQSWTYSFQLFPRHHWAVTYILEDTFIRNMPDYYRNDALAQSVDSVITEGIEEGLDTLTWMTLSTYFASIAELEFSYLGYQIAHLKDHQRIGANALQPIDFSESKAVLLGQVSSLRGAK